MCLGDTLVWPTQQEVGGEQLEVTSTPPCTHVSTHTTQQRMRAVCTTYLEDSALSVHVRDAHHDHSPPVVVHCVCMGSGQWVSVHREWVVCAWGVGSG